MAKWFWHRKATLINHNVTYEERMKQTQQRLENIGLGVGAQINLQEKIKVVRKKRKQKRREEKKRLKKETPDAEDQ